MDQQVVRQQVLELYQKYGGLVLRRCQRLLGDSSAVEDAAQEVFVRILENLEGFREEASAVTWIYRIATNVCFEIMRRNSKRSSIVLASGLVEVLVSQKDTAERQLICVEELSQFLKRLSAKEFQIIVLTYVDEMSQEEVAKTLNLSRKTVWSKLKCLQQRIQARRR